MVHAVLILTFPLQITRSTSYEGNSSSSYCRWMVLQGREQQTQSASAISEIDYSQKRSLFSILNKELCFLPVQGTFSSCFNWRGPPRFKPFSTLVHSTQDPGFLLDTTAYCVVSLVCFFCVFSFILQRAPDPIRSKELWRPQGRTLSWDHLSEKLNESQTALLRICSRV